jgi:hypothetical protein
MLGFTSATTPQVTGAEQTSNLKIIHFKQASFFTNKRNYQKECTLVFFFF